MRNCLKRISMFLVFLAFLALLSSAALTTGSSPSPEQSYLYKTTFVRAAPGKLLDLIALFKNGMAAYDTSGDERLSAIGPYMRTLIDMHRDTMGVAIK